MPQIHTSGTAHQSARRNFVRFVLRGGAWTLTLALIAKARGVVSAAAGIMQRPPRPPVVRPDSLAIRRTVTLSSTAAEAQLPERSWLRFYRDFLTRTGVWQGHPIDTRPLNRRDGRVGVLGPERAPIRESLGIGRVQQMSDGVVTCSTNVCEMLGIAARTNCSAQSCGKNNCANLNCDKNTCGGQDCAKHSCDQHTAQIADFISELTANWNTAFVRELRQQFGADTTADLARAVNDFVLKNGYATR